MFWTVAGAVIGFFVGMIAGYIFCAGLVMAAILFPEKF